MVWLIVYILAQQVPRNVDRTQWNRGFRQCPAFGQFLDPINLDRLLSYLGCLAR